MELVYERTLEFFEGDLLIEYRGRKKSNFYIEKLCTSSNSTYRYLLVRADQRSIAEYLACKLSLLELLNASSDGGGFIVDRENGKVVNTLAVRLDELPDSYIPKTNSYHDYELRPTWKIAPQNFLITENWDGKLIGFIEKQFFGVLGFLYYTEAGKNRRIPQKLFTFSYKGGFPIMHLFNALRTLVPQLGLARPAGVNANSPGVMTFEAQSEITHHLNQSIEALSKSRDQYLIVQNWAKLSQPKVNQGVEKLPPSAYQDLQLLAELMHVDVNSLFPEPSNEVKNPTANVQCLHVAGKLLTAHYRRLKRLLNPEARVEFLYDQRTIDNLAAIDIGDESSEDDDLSDDF